MYHYKIYGIYLISDYEFVQLVSLSHEELILEPQVTVINRAFPDQFQFEQTCYSKIDKSISYLSNSCCYLLVENGDKIYYELKEGGNKDLLNTYLLGWGISMLFYQRGLLPIHCSCVATDQGAILISGDSGSGKSTITTTLLEKGYFFMADDISMVDLSIENVALTSSAFPYQKLCRDAIEKLVIPQEELIYIDETKDKFLVPYKGYFPMEPVKIRALFVLSVTNDTCVVTEELTGVRKFQACMNAMFLRPLLGEQLYAPENGAAGLTLSSRIPIYHIARPFGKDSKEEILKTILDFIK